MGTVTLPNTSKSSSDANLFSDVHDNDDAIITVVNGNIDADNIADASVTSAKLNMTSDQTTNSGTGTVTGSFADITDLTLAGLTAGTYFILGQLSTDSGSDNLSMRFVVDSVATGGAVQGTVGYVSSFLATSVTSEVKIQANEGSPTSNVINGRLTVVRIA